MNWSPLEIGAGGGNLYNVQCNVLITGDLQGKAPEACRDQKSLALSMLALQHLDITAPIALMNKGGKVAKDILTRQEMAANMPQVWQ